MALMSLILIISVDLTIIINETLKCFRAYILILEVTMQQFLINFVDTVHNYICMKLLVKAVTV